MFVYNTVVLDLFKVLGQDDRLLDELPDYLKLALVIAYHTGCRLGEVMSLQWADVNLNGPQPTFTIQAENAKNKRPRTLPNYGDMVAAIKKKQGRTRQEVPKLDWVFHDGTGERLQTL
jgi:integrase